MPRIDRDRVVVTRDRLGETPSPDSLTAALYMRVGEIRLQGDEIVVAGQRFVVPPQRGKHEPGRCGRNGLRIDRESLPQQALRRLGMAELLLGHAEHMQRVGLVWTFFQNLFVPGLSFGEISELMVRFRSGEQDRDAVILPIGWRRTKTLQWLTYPFSTFLPRGVWETAWLTGGRLAAG